ncbi:MAG: hypothetical protein RLZZ557_2064 [Bacteroidota bacterium]
MKPTPNRLIHETSPYLLQHAYNPVNWYPWGEEALALARKEDKPIIVSIGYAACHWCHVMEHESFEDMQTANLMNSHFVCIKVDREERPDLDHFFMDALQAITGHGGWPLNMFLTSDAKPFYGGTYFPPQRVHDRISWTELLMRIQAAYQTRKEEIDAQANELISHLAKSNEVIDSRKLGFIIPEEEMFTRSQADTIFRQLMQSADLDWGGFGRAPKFPQTFSIQYLLRYAQFTGNQEALQHAERSLMAMMRGGIYDQIGGGFCRYSTDTEWLAPHFEKMTYDNALLLIVLAEAYQQTGKPEYAAVIEQTIAFLQREMLSADGGFYAALDADSEGVEGKFYTWHPGEVQAALGDDAGMICSILDITEKGNWEHVSIPRMLMGIEEWSSNHAVPSNEVLDKLEKAKKKLLEARSARIRPATDDKIILGWNALLNQGLVAAFAATGKREWLVLAEQNMAFMIAAFKQQDNQWHHTFKEGVSRFPAFLDDLAYLVQSMIMLQEANGDLHLLDEATVLVDTIFNHFGDEEGLYFYFSPDFQTALPVRKKDQYDGAMPSSNAAMAWNLHKLGILLNKPEWRKRSALMLEANREAAIKYPTSFGVWSNLLLEKVMGTHEVLVLGPAAAVWVAELMRYGIPNKVLMQAVKPDERFPLMAGRSTGREGETLIFVCKDFTCGLPSNSVEDALKQLLTK